MSKKHVDHSYVSVICVTEFEGKHFFCALWLSVHIKSVLEQGFFHKFTFDNKALETFVEFRLW